MKFATWNINGIKARIDVLTAWLEESRPDVVCLQEIKSVDEGFPREAIERLGYEVATHGQKGFNGVAILSRHHLEDVERGLPGDDDDLQARFIEAAISVPCGVVRFAGLYLPNGNPLGTEKFPYKLGWMARLEARARARLAWEEPYLMMGDYNVIPEPIDARTPAAWVGDALFQPESRAAWRRLTGLGYTDCLRAGSDAQTFTFWDYQAGCWPRDEGIRIDHVLASPQATDRLRAVGVDRHVRGWEKPSDHVPVWVELDVAARARG
ncbi:exodeoxyribonuclease III [Siculibacillus lacustris]|uniref:Exodeoxyribonuclease III n=1 Tax=Siculibacillus lacustris TaxID=1549641 RepID=A0A4Q9VQ99_9HYPH|nr:exodeoxyribonuclease III [Siculibacillus lacustris]TBW37986.1 exodeoxyribonuclease III [Siculibacillus lacustris]